MNYKHLAPYCGKQELYLKGRKLPAFSVWRSVAVEKCTPEQAAENWNLTIEAVKEAVAYCEQNQALLKQLAEDELQFAKVNGVSFGSKAACR